MMSRIAFLQAGKRAPIGALPPSGVMWTIEKSGAVLRRLPAVRHRFHTIGALTASACTNSFSYM